MKNSNRKKQPKTTRDDYEWSRADSELFTILLRERNKAIEDFIAVWQSYGANGRRGEDVYRAADYLVIFHQAMACFNERARMRARVRRTQS